VCLGGDPSPDPNPNPGPIPIPIPLSTRLPNFPAQSYRFGARVQKKIEGKNAPDEDEIITKLGGGGGKWKARREWYGKNA